MYPNVRDENSTSMISDKCQEQWKNMVYLSENICNFILFHHQQHYHTFISDEASSNHLLKILYWEWYEIVILGSNTIIINKNIYSLSIEVYKGRIKIGYFMNILSRLSSTFYNHIKILDKLSIHLRIQMRGRMFVCLFNVAYIITKLHFRL